MRVLATYTTKTGKGRSKKVKTTHIIQHLDAFYLSDAENVFNINAFTNEPLSYICKITPRKKTGGIYGDKIDRERFICKYKAALNGQYETFETFNID